MNLQIENPMVLGTIERANKVPTFRYIEEKFKDIYGTLIVSNDDYMEFRNGDIVHFENLHTYLEEKGYGTFKTK